ncbi:MAG: UDP-2,4-diacetamido-2,4,6-trideoxy-beta-L-altropyranose hydrolase [Burkholderiaceae bacterium]
MKLAFRVDASRRIGTGHVVRCLNLARVLAGRGAEVTFICRAHEGHMGAALEREGFRVRMLGAPPRQPADTSEDYAEWLGVPVRQDAEETVGALPGGTDWLVMDHYGLDETWQAAVRAAARRIMAVEDLPGRRHACDLLLDQGALEPGQDGHAQRAPGAQLLLGPRYALLRGEYARQRASLPPRQARSGVFVFFGGTDPGNLTALALEALASPEASHLPATLVLGPNYPFGDSLRAAAAGRPGTTVLGPQPDLASLMARAAVAVGGGGVTTWERMCLGLPAVVVSLAENQRPSCEALARQGLIAYAGHFDEVTAASLASLLVRTAADGEMQQGLATSGMHLVDGLGALRVAEALAPASTGELVLRRARPADAATYFGWVNDPAVRASAFETAAVPWATHEDWFARRLGDPGSMLFVMEARGLPVGQVRFQAGPGGALVDYSLDPLVRGRGWAGHLLEAGMTAAGGGPFRAEVKNGNRASLAVFRRLGFNEEEGEGGRRIFTRRGVVQ